MGSESKIQWTDATFNPWRGCTKVSDGCKNCYADAMSKRNPAVLGIWGKNGTRVVASEAQWKEPVRWNRYARDGVCPKCFGRTFISEKFEQLMPDGGVLKDTRDTICQHCKGKGKVEPYRSRVFCASLADVFEGEDTMPDGSIANVLDARQRLLYTIGVTPYLDWLLLTKRPENVMHALKWQTNCDRWGDGQFSGSCLAEEWLNGHPPPNVWIGTTVENQEQADKRIPELLKIPAAVRFLSMEPLLSDVNLVPYIGGPDEDGNCQKCGCAWVEGSCPEGFGPSPDWIIVGGESGSGARPFDVAWARSIIGQCKAAGVPVFVKQLGSVPVAQGASRGYYREMNNLRELGLWKDKKGGDINEWPEDLRVRELPEVK